MVLAVRNLSDTTILEMLLKHGMSPDAGDGNGLFAAMSLKKFEHFRLLVEAKANVDAFGRRGRNLLHVAAAGPPEYTRLLVEHGADVHALTKRYEDDGCGPEDPQSTRETPLHIAARALRADNVAVLLAANAKQEELDTANLTPLAAAITATLAAESDQAEQKSNQIEATIHADRAQRGMATIKALIDGGCSLEATDTNGQNIRDAILKVVSRSKRAESPETTERDRYGRAVFLVETHYRGPNGLDVTRLAATPRLRQIALLLQPGRK